MGVALGAAGIAGSVIQGVGAVESGYAKSESDAYQAQVAANNAKIAQQDATLEIQAGDVAAFNRQMKTRAQVGSEKARQGASGIDVNTGSAVDVRAGTEELGMLDALTVRSDASKRAYAKQVEATSDTAQSELLKSQSEQDVTAGWLSGAGTLLSNASSVGANWSKYQTMFG
ncbi:hypothetical protein ACRQ5Q_22275 [Bradyrhizobium sp. PMVTL-01]|uniref:hypothetical protein n=1 Tax=Bradyrhizobium sp. PMVTL-01 TaxID=3434999 RepID=UPI003F7028A6